MFRKSFVALIAIVLATSSALAADAQKPNIILIMADDLGYETLGCNGSESYKTPNLDELAATGIRFDCCQVQPVCTPTRVQLMTGISNARNYINFGNMDQKATTFGNLFKNAGYATGIAGKWQLGRDKDLPQRFGFDEAYLWQHTRRPPRYANPGLEHNGEERDFNNGEYGPDLINKFAREFITKNKSKPFFLYYPMMLTHSPFQPTPDSADWDPKATGEDSNKGVKYFADNVAYMDKLVGKIVKKVDELGIRDNTLILFLGDNGTGPNVVSKWKGQKYPGGKGSTTARGMHVPLIANWPGHAPAGKVNDDIIDSTDFLPTICEAAGIEIPSSLALDGKTFFPQILGKPGEPREWVYTWYSSKGVPPIREFAATKEYKLYRDGRFYDLKKDPFEEGTPQQISNVTGDEATTAKKLQGVLASFNGARSLELQKLSVENEKQKPPKKGQGNRKKRRQAAEAASE